VRGLHLRLALENIEDNGSAAQGHQEADKHRLAQTQAKVPGHQEKQKTGGRHLQRTAEEHRATQLQEIGKGKFNADGEQQQNDPDFRQDLHFMGHPDKAQHLGAGQHPGENETHQGRDPQAVTDENHPDGQGINDNQIKNDGDFHEGVAAAWGRLTAGGKTPTLSGPEIPGPPGLRPPGPCGLAFLCPWALGPEPRLPDFPERLPR